MDIREYIQSGIIEQYVLGLATAEEAAELEQLRSQYSELHEAVTSFEKEFEQHLLSNPVQPSSNIKSLIEQELFPDSSKAKVVAGSFENKPLSSPNINIWKWLAAACIILLIGSTALNFYFWNTYRSSEENYEALLQERNTLQANNASYKNVLDSLDENINSLQSNYKNYKNQVADLEQSFKIMHDPDVKEIKLKGILNKNNLATVYWNTQTKQVYFFKNYMRQVPTGKQYQLWAIVHGKPVSAGLIDVCSGLCKMKVIPEAEAFAVTLEKEGGSDVPTLTAMYVLGKV